MSRAIDSIAREHASKAIDTLVEVMTDPFAENRDRISAADKVLDRGHGKPSQAIIAVPGNRAAAALLASMSDDELMKILNQTQLPRLSGPSIDAEFSEVAPAIDPLLQ